MSVSGVLVIDKPSGMTSHDVVARVRKTLKTRKVGHAGTLDPDVTGVLVLCIGDATRLIEYLSANEKVYEGRTVFGIATDTDDASGNIVRVASAAHLTEEIIKQAAKRFLGDTLQAVPAYSAVHIAGKRAYELARMGEAFERPVRQIHIESLDVWGFIPGERAEVSFRVRCSKGTYVRALCRDWGDAVGVPAHMSMLRRIQAGQFSIEDAIPLSEWASLEHPERCLLPMSEAVRGLPALYVSQDQAERLAHGQSLLVDDGCQEGTVAVFLEDVGELVAMCQFFKARDRGRVVPRKVFWKKGT
jgi:tRNA pseudouridine55 synthase